MGGCESSSNYACCGYNRLQPTEGLPKFPSLSGQGVKLRIFHINDVYVLDNLPALKAHVKIMGHGMGFENVITTLSGDFVAPSVLSAIDHGAGMVDCLNKVPVDYVCFGNHESDIPHDSLISRIKQFNGVWLNSNMPGFDGPAESLPVYTMVKKLEVLGRKVALIGLLVSTQSLYRRGAFNSAVESLVPILEIAPKLVERIKKEHPDVDCVIPLTHQNLEDDVKLADTGLFPVILGGHDHTVHKVEQNGCLVVKAGEDAKNVFVVDLEWKKDDPPGTRPHVFSQLVPLCSGTENASIDIAPDEELEDNVVHWMQPVYELQAATLARYPVTNDTPLLTSIGVRYGDCTMAALLASALRDATDADGAVINGGSVRGNREYRDGLITYAHLTAEVPFPSAIIVVPMPGKVLSEAVRISRQPWIDARPATKEVNSALHNDDQMRLSQQTGEVTHVCGRPLEPDTVYNIAIDTYVVRKNLALKEYSKQFPERIPPDDAGQPALACLVRYFCKRMWLKLADLNEDGVVTFSELEDLFRSADTNEDHLVDFEELLDVLNRNLGEGMASRVLARQMMNLADINQDGRADFDELMNILRDHLALHAHPSGGMSPAPSATAT